MRIKPNDQEYNVADNRHWRRDMLARRDSLRRRPPHSLINYLVNNARISILEWYPEGDKLTITGDMASRLGIAPDQFPHSMAGFLALVGPGDQAGLKADIERSLSSHKPFNPTFSMQGTDGSVTYWQLRGASVSNRKNESVALVGVMREATEQVMAENRLVEINEFLERRMQERNAQLEEAVSRLEKEVDQRQQAEMRYRIIAELISDFAYVAHLLPDGMFVMDWFTESAVRIFGYSIDQAITSEQWLAMTLPEDRERAASNMARVAQGETVTDEMRFVRRDGKIICMSMSMKPILNPQDNRVTMVFGAGQEITQRKQAEQALTESRARFHTLFNHSPVSLWEEDHSAVKLALDDLRQQGVTDFSAYFQAHQAEALELFRTVKVLNFNRAAVNLYENISIENLESTLYNIIQTDIGAWIQQLVAIAAGEKEFELERANTISPGHVLYSELHFSTVPGYEKTYGRTLISILDVTARRRIEQSLRYDARRLRLLNEITTESLALGDFKTTLRNVAERMRVFAGAEDCFITRWDAEKQVPEMLAGTGDVEERVLGHAIAPGEPNVTRSVMEADRVLLIKPDDTDMFNQPNAHLFGNGTAVGLPLKVGELKIGAAVLVFHQPPQLNDDDLDLWDQVAAQVSLAITSHQLFDQSRQRTYELEKLVQVSSEMRQALSFEDIVKILIREIALILDADSSALVIKRGKNWLLATANEIRLGSKMGEYELNEQTLNELVTKVDQFEHDVSFINGYIGNIGWLRGMGSFTYVPIRTSDSTIGLAGVGWRSHKELNPSHRRLLTAVAEIAGSALQRSNLLETLEQRVQDRTRDLKILYDLSALANRQQGVKKVAQSALRQMVKVLGGKGGFLYNPVDGEPVMEISYTVGIPTSVRKLVQRLPLESDRMSRLQNSREPVYVPDASYSAEVPREFFAHGLNAAIWAPIWADMKLWGFMAIMGEVAELNPEEKPLFKAVTDLLATIAENAALQKKSKDIAVMEERQRLARALHDSVTQSLYSLSLFSEAGREHAQAGNPERTLHYLERSSETAKQALREMRMLLYELRPPELEKLGLAGALRFRLDAVEQRVGLEPYFEEHQTAPLAAEVDEALFWIAQEALNNTLRHAKATKVNVYLKVDPRRVVLIISDNGQGFDLKNQAGGGMGLVSMRERAEKIQAVLRIESNPGQGTRVQVNLHTSGLKKEN